METTRHFVTTVYVVNGEETALHEHKKLDMLLAPGGHIDRDEIPHEAAEREVFEETGLEVEINGSGQVSEFGWSKGIPEPQHVVLDDVVVKDGEPAHQHINLVYYAEVGSKIINPTGDSEVSSDRWYWFDRDQLDSGHPDSSMSVGDMTRKLGKEAIEEFSE